MTNTASADASIKGLSFEDALTELERIVASLERGEVSLDDAIAAFERGTALKSHCEARLEAARMRVEKIKAPVSGGAPSVTENFDPDQS